jgi:hypothetical protein
MVCCVPGGRVACRYGLVCDDAHKWELLMTALHELVFTHWLEIHVPNSVER